ncbi:two-component regulator propeller domain-containing protein [Bacteroides sp. 51]|uniref:hybrid sensor histidine kinase/response regulator transcription factor n=1 Tax=Bacteroides sp. 51 TaxID=2302938 RepID=UPI0013D07FCE|nr:two-component regulator propeller domain-containing protein [Bacteroides sp. 51]NDV84645.1 response regulator [Bacteroides sp. 51]
MRDYRFAIILILFSAIPIAVQAFSHDITRRLEFKQINSLNGLPNDEVQKVFQDREGFMWFATRYGLCKYDGYQVTTIKSDVYNPDLLTSNNIRCLGDDADHNLWIGTFEGVNVLNKATGVVRKGDAIKARNGNVPSILVSKDNTVWISFDTCLYRYNIQGDSLEIAIDEDLDKLFYGSENELFEDSDGDIWIGSWNSGLYRFSPSKKKLYTYPPFNPGNSAHTIFEDSRKNIWIGSWNEGLYLLENPKDMERLSWKVYKNEPHNPSSLSDNIVYALNEDLNTGTLWVGSRSGVSIMSLDRPGEFMNYTPTGSSYYIPHNEINSIIRDKSGKLWLGSIGGGVFMVDTHKPQFEHFHFEAPDKSVLTVAVRSLFVDKDEMVWMGIGNYGVARYDRIANKYLFYSAIPEFSEIRNMPTTYSIIQRKETGDLWFGSYNGGVYIYRKGQKVEQYMPGNSDFVMHHIVTALYEDQQGNCWVGTRTGLGVKRADGVGHLFKNMREGETDLSSAYIRDIMEDTNGDIWLASTNLGLIRISGDVYHPESLQYTSYSIENKKIIAKSIICLKRDSQGRLWVGTEGHGLFLYNHQEDRFESKSIEYNLPGDLVGSIEEDGRGNLWLGTNKGLVRLSVSQDTKTAELRVYTAVDGLQNNFFIPHSSCQFGNELFFGGFGGYNSFKPDYLDIDARDVPFQITDIKVYNKSFSALDETVRNRISSQTPTFTQKIEIPYNYNNFNLEFASLTYKNPELNKYAYRLNGFDKDWQYTDATRHFAYYNNLESGTYTFQLRATNENGIWSGQMRELTVVVLPPFWATWWAYLIYFLITIAIVYYAYRVTKNRMVLKNSLELQKMEKAKAEELNHAKLQFFTNITHELLTPLTIISATVDELKMQAPQYTNLYPVISTNIQRLIRLLQQILEFRKAETGNLKLRVSPGDLAVFIQNEAEAFQPLIKKRKLHFSILCDPDTIYGYFDTDKLDKILYNLFSNSAKYSHEGGFIQVNLSYANTKDYVLITVKDNGKGISLEKQKTLFKRFYEGDYRKSNTIGTGIGLSLAKDLVELHGGTIWLESEQDKGATFFVRLPIERSYFKEEEIDEDVIPITKTVSGIEATPIESVGTKEDKKYSILVLEDNEDLLQLMMTLLSREYNVFTAENGKEGIVIVENEDIDLVVSDIMMPEMDGIEFCKYIKGKLEFSHIPVVLLTAKNKEEDRAEAYESGADGFISKPFNLAVLHARIKNLLKTKERTARDFKNQLVFEVKDLNYTTIDEEFMQNAIDCVNRHLDDPDFDQPQFIEEMGTSKSTLYKKLKSLTGLNTSSFIRNIRLKAAIKIMEEKKEIRVSELAYAVGFNDPKYFSSCFKKEFGILPTEYMERFLIS